MGGKKQRRAQLPKERSRSIWEPLVQYANSGEADALVEAFNSSADRLPVPLEIDEVVEIRDYLREHGDALARADKMQEALLAAMRYGAEQDHHHLRLATMDEWLLAAVRYWVEQHHSHLRLAVTWLCRPDKHPELARKAARFLWTHSEGLRLALKDGNVDFHEGNQIFFWPILEKCSSIMSPICRFLVDQIWQFQEGHLTLRETIPVQICEREGCGNFTLAERVGRKRFCSNQCRALAYQGSREDWNEYMRNYRKLREQRKGKIKSRRRTKGKR